jgi:hypothetical protein
VSAPTGEQEGAGWGEGGLGAVGPEQLLIRGVPVAKRLEEAAHGAEQGLELGILGHGGGQVQVWEAPVVRPERLQRVLEAVGFRRAHHDGHFTDRHAAAHGAEGRPAGEDLREELQGGLRPGEVWGTHPLEAPAKLGDVPGGSGGEGRGRVQGGGRSMEGMTLATSPKTQMCYGQRQGEGHGEWAVLRLRWLLQAQYEAAGWACRIIFRMKLAR